MAEQTDQSAGLAWQKHERSTLVVKSQTVLSFTDLQLAQVIWRVLCNFNRIPCVADT